METIEQKSDSKVSNVSVVIKTCEKSAMECLICSHNKHPQYNVKLTPLFNDWIDLKQIKWIEFNDFCDLNNSY